MKYNFALALLFMSVYSYAQPGTLDNSFSADGIATFDFLGGTDSGSDMKIQPDGKIVFCGGTGSDESFSNQDLYVARINADGLFDNTFGTNGLTRTLRPSYDQGFALDIQADGKIVVGGTASGVGGGYNFYIVRFNTDGSLDLNFGVDGQVVHEVSVASDELADITVQADGKIIAIGRTNGGADYDIVVVRFNPDGSIDNTFSFDGEVITDVAGDDRIEELYVHDNGKITALGRVSVGTQQVLVIRYNADGTLDNSFGSNGILLLSLVSGNVYPKGLAVTSAGEMIITAELSAGNSDVLLARLLADGTLDNSFSLDGIVQTDFGERETGYRTLVQPDSRILVAGYSEDAIDRSMALFRYNWDGTLDNTFGVGGQVVSPLAEYSRFYSVALHEDGKIVACGTFTGAISSDVCVARYHSGINVGIGDVDAYIGSTLIYPNPITNNSITVEYELKADETVSIELYDLGGKQLSVLQSATEEKADSYQKTLLLPTLSAGNYLLKLNTEKGAVSVKLMVN